MPLRLNGSTSGYSQIDAPAVAGDQTFTLPGTGGTLDRLNRAGNVIQVVEANYTSTTSTTATIPADGTTPQNTEGTELLTASITPTSSANKLLIQISIAGFLCNASGPSLSFALFQDSTASALASQQIGSTTGGYGYSSFFSHYMTAGTASSTTFKLRYGPSSQTLYINRFADGTSFSGGVTPVRLVIWEVAA